MESKSIIEIVVAVVIGIIMIGPLVSVIGDAQVTNGDEITLSNDHGPYLYSAWAGEDIVIAYDGTALTSDNSGYTIDGDPTDLTFSRNPNIVVASNDFAIRTGGTQSQGARLVIVYLGEIETSSSIRTFSISVSDGEYSLTVGDSEVLTGTIDWMVMADTDGDIGISQMTDYTNFYTTNTENLIVLGSIYVTGENDTFYSYYEGTLTVNEEYISTSSVEIAKSLADGYTDIYDTSVTITVGDETFHPFYVLAPIQVNGHAASGPMYDLLGVIPLLVTIGLIMGIVGAVFVRRFE